MHRQLEHAHLLNKLHIKGDPLILFNIWDAGSAQAIQADIFLKSDSINHNDDLLYASCRFGQ